MRRTPPLIVGGGPAGTAAAITLARAGVHADLIERTAAPHDPVCGGFLGWDALAALAALDIDPWRLGAQPIHHVRIVAGNALAEAALPAMAAGISRRTLDAALLDRATELGVAVTRGLAVRRVEHGVVHFSDGTAHTPQGLFLATGKYALRGLPRDCGRPARVGLRAAIPAPADLAGWIELHLLNGGYAGLLVQEDGRANFCLSIASPRLLEAGGSPDTLIAGLAKEAPRLLDRLGAARFDWSAIAAIPYGWRARETHHGCFRLGDQAAVIASIAGDGIAFSLASGRMAAEAWLAGGAAAAPRFQRGFASRARGPLAVAEKLRYIAERPALARFATRSLALLPTGLPIAARLTRIGH